MLEVFCHARSWFLAPRVAARHWCADSSRSWSPAQCAGATLGKDNAQLGEDSTLRWVLLYV